MLVTVRVPLGRVTRSVISATYLIGKSSQTRRVALIKRLKFFVLSRSYHEWTYLDIFIELAKTLPTT